VGVVSLAVTAGLTLVPWPWSAQADTVTLTLKASRSTVVTGGTVTVSGSLTDNGKPVTGARVNLSVDDPMHWSSPSVSTDSSGHWSLPVKVTLTTTVSAQTATAISTPSSVKITAVARASLTLGPGVARPYLLDPATVHASPAVAWVTSYSLQVREAGTTAWRTMPDTAGVWGVKPGTLYVRAVASVPGYAVPGASPQVKVVVRNGTVPAWLRELNAYRALNNALPVAEDAHLSYADSLHVQYMEKNGLITHVEVAGRPGYTKLGAQAGLNSDLTMGFADPVRTWAGAPFHALSELSRIGTRAGYAAGGGFAALWVDPTTSLLKPTGPAYQYPANGKTTSLLAYTGNESPDPIATCPQAWRDRISRSQGVGLPIIFGNQNSVTKPTASLSTGGKSLQVCLVSASILGWVREEFIIPLLPLQAHHTYTVTMKYSGKLQSRWQFGTS
jgi:hypothetical protein